MVGALQAADLLTALRALGLDTADLCRRVGLRPARLRDPAGSIPMRVAAELLAAAARRAGDPLVGLRAGARAQPRGPLFYLLISSPFLGEGLRQIARFSHLAADSLRFRIGRGTDAVRFVIDPGEEAEESPLLVDYMMMAVARTLRIAVGAEFRLREVQMRHPPWKDLAEAADIFGCPVWCNRSENRLVFPVECLEIASRGANPLIAKQIEKFSEARAAHATRPATFRKKVADATRELLAEGLRADRATVARQLHVSRRTLQRRLEGERTTFRAVRDAVLWEVVEALLSNPLLKIEFVALSVGFADVAAFSKAFKRRAGCSPTVHRQRLAAAARRANRPRLVRAK